MGCFYDANNLVNFSYESTTEIKLAKENIFISIPKESDFNSTIETKQLEINSSKEKKNSNKENEKCKNIKRILTRISLEKFNTLFDDNLDEYYSSKKKIKCKNYKIPKKLNIQNLTKSLNTTNDYTFETI